ncbi:MAG TPA: DMT family transporter [Hyphomicrobium sp.]|nr:DMT family transporter [Hyphomicrobium sp.]
MPPDSQSAPAATLAPSPPRALAPYLLMVLPGVVWGGNAIVARAFAGELPPVGLAFWRWMLAALLVLPFAWPHVRRDAPAMIRAWPIMVLLSALGIAFFNAALYIAAHTTTALNILMLQAAMPVLIVAATFLLFNDRITARQGAGVALSLAGATTLITHGDPHVLTDLAFNVGDLWMLAACILYAVYTALLRLRPAVHWLSFLFAIFFLGAMLLLPFYIGETLLVQPMPVSVRSLLAIGYVSLFASAIGYGAFNRAVELLGANTAGLSVYLVPVFGTVFAVLLLGERPELYQLAGIALIVAGILLAVRRTS